MAEQKSPDQQSAARVGQQSPQERERASIPGREESEAARRQAWQDPLQNRSR